MPWEGERRFWVPMTAKRKKIAKLSVLQENRLGHRE